MKKTIKLFEAFAGIGSQHSALKNVFDNAIELVGMFEWYVDAIVAYEAIHNNLKINKKITKKEILEELPYQLLSLNSKEPLTKKQIERLSQEKLQTIYSAYLSSKNKSKNFFNILGDKKEIVDSIDEIDILTYSFPCQDLSLQGKQLGMSRDSNSRSSLLWQIDEFLNVIYETDKNKLPKVLLMENVKNVIQAKHIKEFERWLERLKKYGYKSDYKILNSKNFGSVQSRERCFCLSVLDKKIELPLGNEEKAKSFKSIISKELPEKYEFHGFDNLITDTNPINFKYSKRSNISKMNFPEYSKFNSEAILYNPEKSLATLTASGANARLKFLYDGKIRLIQPIESYLAMGFTKKQFTKVKETNFLPDNKIIYTAGNSISVELLEEVFSTVLKELKWI